jgi:hypothetical protein
MSEETNPLESILDRLTTERTDEQHTLEELARQKIVREDDELKRNLSELERLAGGEEGP